MTLDHVRLIGLQRLDGRQEGRQASAADPRSPGTWLIMLRIARYRIRPSVNCTMISSITSNPFVGRERELGELTSALDSALEGRGGIVMLAGEPGIGKTRLAEELAEIARERGFGVHWGRCYEDTGAPPYWPWTQLLRSCASSGDHESVRQAMGADASIIADIFPDLKTWFPDLEQPPEIADPESARFRLFDSTSTYLATWP